MCLNAEQKLLVALEGTWIGTASDAHTMSGTNRIVMEMALPPTDEPTLEGLTGTIWFGEKLDTSSVDPEYPRIDEGYSNVDIRDGFVFTLRDMDLLEGRLLGEFDIFEQWREFCEAQTVTYNISGNLYSCIPNVAFWWSEPGEGPNGEPGVIYHGPDGEEVFISNGKEELCAIVCACDLSGCTQGIGDNTPYGQLDLTVDIGSGVMIGTGSEGSIEATKQ